MAKFGVCLLRVSLVHRIGGRLLLTGDLLAQLQRRQGIEKLLVLAWWRWVVLALLMVGVRLLLVSLVHQTRRPIAWTPLAWLVGGDMRIVTGVGENRLWLKLRRVGIGTRTRRRLWSASSGILRKWMTWKAGSGSLWWPMWAELGRR